MRSHVDLAFGCTPLRGSTDPAWCGRASFGLYWGLNPELEKPRTAGNPDAKGPGLSIQDTMEGGLVNRRPRVHAKPRGSRLWLHPAMRLHGPRLVWEG